MANEGSGGLGQPIAPGATDGSDHAVAPDASPSWAALAAKTSSDALLVTDGGGVIHWANAQADELLGHAPGQLLGTNMFSLLSEEEQHLALQAVVFIEHLPGLVAPAVYNPRRADGSRIPIEVNAAFLYEIDEAMRADLDARGFAASEPPFIVVAARRADHHNLLTGGFERLTRGEPFGVVVTDILEELVARWPDYHSGLLMTEHGRRVLHGDVPRPVRSAMTANPIDLDDFSTTPWVEAIRHGSTVFRRVADLPEPLAAHAAEAGLQACLVIVLPDPGDLDPCLVLWIGNEAPFVIEAFWTGSPYFILLSFALQRHYYLSSLERAATTDSLTGLANRAAFFDQLETTTSNVVAVLYLDLDNFKPVNDQFGHAVGDVVLAEVATRLRSAMRPGDLVARLGGDELAVLCTSISTLSEATRIADRLLQTFVEPISCGDEKVTISTSIGIALHRGPTLQGDALVECADRALYDAKRAGKGRWAIAEDA
jgi:diguanylate cyclase (GGDEF)-like protein/PAS domain S-box-containing protein